MKTLIQLIVLGLLVSSCTTSKIRHYQPKAESSNGLLEIRNPHYKKKVNLLGYATMAGFAAGLGYLGHSNPFVNYNSKTDEVNSPEASAAIASLAGLGLVISGNYTLGQKDKLSYLGDVPSEFKKWAGKYNKNYKVVISRSSKSRLLLINKNAEQYYTFNTMDDVDIFVESFPNSNHNVLICSRSYKNLPFTTLPTLLEKVNIKGTSIENEIKLHYINSSRSLSEYISAIKLFPNIKKSPYSDGIDYIGSMIDVTKYTEYFSSPDKDRLIEKAVNFATTFNTVKYFNTEFPSNPYFDKVILDIVSTSSDFELEELIRLFPNSSSINNVKEEYILRAENSYSFIQRNAKYDFYNFKSSYDLTNSEECKSFVLTIKNNDKIPEPNKNTFITSASEEFSTTEYKNKNTTDKSQEEYISYVQDNDWLSKIKADTYINKANNQI